MRPARRFVVVVRFAFDILVEPLRTQRRPAHRHRIVVFLGSGIDDAISGHLSRVLREALRFGTHRSNKAISYQLSALSPGGSRLLTTLGAQLRKLTADR